MSLVKGNAQFLFLCNTLKSQTSWVCNTFPWITQKNLNCKHILLIETDHCCNFKLYENTYFKKKQLLIIIIIVIFLIIIIIIIIIVIIILLLLF